jgi:hypothetical protein
MISGKALQFLTGIIGAYSFEFSTLPRKTSIWWFWLIIHRLVAFIKASVDDLSVMSRILGSVETQLSHEDLSRSFKAWKSSREERELFQKPIFSLSDLDFIMDIINSHLYNNDWIQGRYEAPLRSLSFYDLLSLPSSRSVLGPV